MSLKTLLTPVLALFVLLPLIYQFSENQGGCNGRSGTSDPLRQKMQPYDHFWQIRAYPDTSMDVPAFHASVREAVARSNDRSGAVSANTAWRLEGPVNIAGRVNTLAVHPDNLRIMFAGTSTGGIFRTLDGGQTWEPVFDREGQLAIGHIVFDPQNPNVILVGTGDRNVPGFTVFGDGIWKSTDGGDTWTSIGLSEQRIISKLIIHPEESNTIFAATMGLISTRDTLRGLYRTENAGETWEQILYVSDSSGIIDLVVDPTNPDILYAASWNRHRTQFNSIVSGVDSKIFKTEDGGDTWTHLTNGLPGEPMGRIGLAISQNNPETLYAQYVNADSDMGGIYKTTSGGSQWLEIPTDDIDNILGGFGWYFGRIEINPKNDNEIWVCGVDIWKTTTGGAFWDQAAPPWWLYEVHADKHDIVFRGDTILLTSDGGVYRSVNNGEDWESITEFPSIQFYRVAVNPHKEDDYWGGAQDNGTLHGNSTAPDQWDRAFGGDGFQPVFHSSDPEIIYVQTQNGGIHVSDNGGLSFDNGDFGIENDDRRNWDMPMIMSHHNPEVLYTGTYRVYMNTCGNLTCWVPVSDDLTDGIVYEERYHTISAIEASPLNDALIVAGTSDGNVWYTDDQGVQWNNISEGLPDRYVTSIQASEYDEGTFWVTHTGYRSNDHFPHIHVTFDFGATWIPIHGDMPILGINKVIVFPENEQVIFAGTDAGVYATLDGGEHWERLGSNLPFVPVLDMALDMDSRRLLAGTFGRSMHSFPVDSFYLPTSISTLTHATGVRISITPNPAMALAAISVDSEVVLKGELILYSAQGKVLGRWIMPTTATRELDVSGLSAGTYFCAWNNATGNSIEKFIVLH